MKSAIPARCGVANLFHGGVGLGNADVFGNGGVEEVGVLLQEGNALVELCEANALQRDAVDENLARRRRVKSQQQAKNRGFAYAEPAPKIWMSRML